MLPIPNGSSSPGSRRSSSISTLGQAGLSTISPFYSRAPVKRKRPTWKIVSHPLPPSGIYRRSLLVALLSSAVASLIFLSATLHARWESVHFVYENLFKFKFQPDLSENQTFTSGGAEPRHFTVDVVAFRNGYLATEKDLKVFEQRPTHEPYTLGNILGIILRLTEHRITDTKKAKRYHKAVLFPPLGKSQHLFAAQHLDDGELLTKNAGLQEEEFGWVVMDFHAGIWSMCYEDADIYKVQLLPHYNRLAKGASLPPACQSYLASNISETKNLCSQFFLKMQNNIISCVIVVYLCMASSMVIGIFATIFRSVPASMVSGVLQVTSGVFVIFANCIHHTKLNRLEYEWGPCHPISRIPDELYQPEFIQVQSHWSLILSWISSPIFFVASFAWFILTQLMTNENSKMLI